MFLVINGCLFVSIVYTNVIVLTCYSHNFVKSNVYPELSKDYTLILSRVVRSRLMCTSQCAIINTCSAILKIEKIGSAQRLYACYFYNAINYNNVSTMNEPVEIWYKTPPGGQNEAVPSTQTPCPDQFTLVGNKCYHAPSSASVWEAAREYCTDGMGGQLVQFESVKVGELVSSSGVVLDEWNMFHCKGKVHS